MVCEPLHESCVTISTTVFTTNVRINCVIRNFRFRQNGFCLNFFDDHKISSTEVHKLLGPVKVTYILNEHIARASFTGLEVIVDAQDDGDTGPVS